MSAKSEEALRIRVEDKEKDVVEAKQELQEALSFLENPKEKYQLAIPMIAAQIESLKDSLKWNEDDLLERRSRLSQRIKEKQEAKEKRERVRKALKNKKMNSKLVGLSEADLANLYLKTKRLPLDSLWLPSVGWDSRKKPDYAYKKAGKIIVIEFVKNAQVELKDITSYPSECYRIGADYRVVFVDGITNKDAESILKRLKINFEVFCL